MTIFGKVDVIDPKIIIPTLRKHFSAENLNKQVRERLKHAKDFRNQSYVKISQVDALMSGFAMFTLKIPSLLQLDDFRNNDGRVCNLKNLFGIETIPSDTSMREILDEVNPQDLRPAFKDIFRVLQRGKALEPFTYIDGKYLVAIDGTGYFSSDTVHCSSCLEKHHKQSGKTTYYHQMLGAVVIHPDQKVVIPLCPEPIIKQDGETKNDCERNACRRILEKIREDHPRLPIIITEDGLSSNAPHIRDLKQFRMSFILGAKPGDHKFLFEEFSLAGSRIKELLIREEKTVHILRYVNAIQLNESSKDITVNFLDHSIFEPNGVEKHFSWVTDIEINDENVYSIAKGGRARWKIENETFNTLKNQGYEFEHNYGHGDKNLSVVLAFLMMLAFLVDQAQLLSSKIVQAALEKVKRKKELYRKVRGLFDHFIFHSWGELYAAIVYGMEISWRVRRPTANSS